MKVLQKAHSMTSNNGVGAMVQGAQAQPKKI